MGTPRVLPGFSSILASDQPRSWVAIWGWSRWRALLLSLVIVGLSLIGHLVTLPSLTMAAAPPHPQPANILLLSSWADYLPWSQGLVQGISQGISTHSDGPPNLFIEYLDRSRLKDAVSNAEWATFLQQKYRSIRLDAAIVDGTSAIDFMFKYGETTFGDLTYVLLPAYQLNAIPFRRSAVVTIGPIVRKTVALALRFHSDLQRFVLIGDDSPEPQALLQELMPVVRELAPQAELQVKTEFQIDELEQSVRTLPPHTVIIFTLVFKDQTGQFWRPVDVVNKLAAVSAAPIYVFYDSLIGNGAVGGHVQSATHTGHLALQAVYDLMAEAHPTHVSYQVADTILDWRALKKWDIPAALIPKDAEIRYRQPSLWETHLWQTLTALTTIVIESLFLLAVSIFLLQRRRFNRQLLALNAQLEARVAERTQELHHRATHDDLTSLCNRQEFYRRAQIEMARSRLEQAPFSLAIIDIDKFKGINDTHGHLAGDQVLQQIALALTQFLSPEGTLGRIGGEEFAMLLPATSLESAAVRLNQMRRYIEDMPITLASGRTLYITISIGLALSKPDDLDLESIVHRADQRLYQAKRSGRNQVVYLS